jgi:hypothetical protein
MEKKKKHLKSFPFEELEMQFNREQMLPQPRRFHYKVMEVLLQVGHIFAGFERRYG